MYIPINEKIFKELKHNVIATSKMGSAIHGTKNEHSDDDLLYLYYDKDYSAGMIRDTNGWQYKDKVNNIDHNFQEIRTFIQNVITSESHTDHEAIVFGFEADNRLVRTILNELNIITYRTVKSYSGRAKKDRKAIENILSNDTYDVDALNKKYYHLFYGTFYMAHLLNGESMPSTKQLIHIKNNGLSKDEYDNLLTLYTELNDTMQSQFESGQLKQRPDSEWFAYIDKLLQSLIENFGYSDEFTFINFGGLLYQVMEMTPTGFHTKR